MILSIITINYNNAEGLKNTIESVTSQDLTNIEYIVIDGGSKDNSIEFIKNNNKIYYWISENDNGIYHAMNKGIKAAQGRYLLFLNSGDIIDPETSLQEVLEYLKSNEDLVCFDMKMGTISKFYTKMSPVKPDFKFFIFDALPHQATFIKKERLSEYGGYDESLEISSDWTFFIDMICKENASYKHVARSFTIFDITGVSSNSENADFVYKERDRHIEKTYPHFYSLYINYKESIKNKEIIKEQNLIIDKLKSARSINLIKKIGMLKWFDISK